MKRLFYIIIIIVALFGITLQGGADNRQIYQITLEDEVITPVASEYIGSAIKKAEAEGAECLIIKLDTPGGLLTSTRKIVKDMMGAEIPIVVYVAPSGARAGSAGVFITLAANIVAMAPSTNIGAAHPVSLQEKKSLSDTIEEIVDKFKKDGKGEKAKKRNERRTTNDERRVTNREPRAPMQDKILNDTIAWVKGIAETRGRNATWAVKAVTESRSITAEEALKKGVINLIAKDIDDLLEKIDGTKVLLPEGERVLVTKGRGVADLPMSWRQQILAILASPNIAYILMMLGFYGLIFEFTHPGVGFPGVAGVIAIIVAFYGLHMLDANYAGVALIILSIILFIMEVKIVSYGLLTLGGLVSLVIGSLMLFDAPDDFMRVSMPVIASFAVTTFAVIIFLATMVVRTHRRKVSTGMEGLIGSEANVVSWRGQKGKVFVHGEFWNAESESACEKGDTVVVCEVKGMKVVVK